MKKFIILFKSGIRETIFAHEVTLAEPYIHFYTWEEDGRESVAWVTSSEVLSIEARQALQDAGEAAKGEM